MKTKIWTDPIVDEIHAIREEMDRETGYDMDALVKMLQEAEKLHPERMSDRKPMKIKIPTEE